MYNLFKTTRNVVKNKFYDFMRMSLILYILYKFFFSLILLLPLSYIYMIWLDQITYNYTKLPYKNIRTSNIYLWSIISYFYILLSSCLDFYLNCFHTFFQNFLRFSLLWFPLKTIHIYIIWYIHIYYLIYIIFLSRLHLW